MKCIALLCVLIVGCTGDDKPQETVPPPPPTTPAKAKPQPNRIERQNPAELQIVIECPVMMEGVKYIPEAGVYIDYVEDKSSYHYHGRNRDMIPEEAQIYEVEQELAEHPGDMGIKRKLEGLNEMHAAVLDRIETEDEMRLAKLINTLVASARKEKEALARKAN